jgi:hypothetical protein
VAKFNKEIAGNENVEFIHVSLDSNEESALEWAKKENFPWLHVMKTSIAKADLAKFKTERFVPFYCFVDKDGKVLAKGSQASFAKAKEFAQ